MLGFGILPDTIVDCEQYGLSSVYHYRNALGTEPKELAGEPFTVFGRRAPPGPLSSCGGATWNAGSSRLPFHPVSRSPRVKRHCHFFRSRDHEQDRSRRRCIKPPSVAWAKVGACAEAPPRFCGLAIAPVNNSTETPPRHKAKIEAGKIAPMQIKAIPAPPSCKPTNPFFVFHQPRPSRKECFEMKFSEFIRSHGFEPRDLSDDQLDNMAEWHSRLATDAPEGDDQADGDDDLRKVDATARHARIQVIEGSMRRIPRRAQQGDSRQLVERQDRCGNSTDQVSRAARAVWQVLFPHQQRSFQR